MDRLAAAYETARSALLAERNSEGFWTGELSTSALSTATAVMALSLVRQHGRPAQSLDDLIQHGMHWLVENQNSDGGWGDTTRSISNISTSMLCRAAFELTGTAEEYAQSLGKLSMHLQATCGASTKEQAEAIRRRYGKDRTFATPILTTCALAGLIPWQEVPPLPFELACFPQSWFRFLKLHVVSYALPALIAMGQAIHFHNPTWNPLTRTLRFLSRKRSLDLLQYIQPSSGGFLEAVPLTSFVTLSLASIGLADHLVAQSGVRFLLSSVRPDGSWAIDSNLSIWVTTLSINALAAAGDVDELEDKAKLRDWLLKQQGHEPHPFTGANPGAWGWTHLPGSVPDADDTPGALLALAHLGMPMDDPWTWRGLQWLADLQNSDGGWPTFCRGWGHLPFDRSGADLTAHAIRALSVGRQQTPWAQQTVHAGLNYLEHGQRPDGSWLPLWFGNQYAPDDENPAYGTARVLAAYRDLDRMNLAPARRAVAWLLSIQNPDGGWGGAKGIQSSIEETALVVEVLLSAGPQAQPAVNKGLEWLVQQVESGGLQHSTPIGFYFAKLWYFEKLYPIIFTVAALGRALRNSPQRHRKHREIAS